jgi:hypothetical protein
VIEIQNGFRGGKKDQLRWQYIPTLKVNRRPLKKLKPAGKLFYLTKQCDVLIHKFILASLNCCGVSGTKILCFKSCMSHWIQCVEINHKVNTNLEQEKSNMVSLKVQFLEQYINDFPINIMGSQWFYLHILLCCYVISSHKDIMIPYIINSITFYVFSCPLVV